LTDALMLDTQDAVMEIRPSLRIERAYAPDLTRQVAALLAVLEGSPASAGGPSPILGANEIAPGDAEAIEEASDHAKSQPEPIVPR
jgi:hypothetical protein